MVERPGECNGLPSMEQMLLFWKSQEHNTREMGLPRGKNELTKVLAHNRVEKFVLDTAFA